MAQVLATAEATPEGYDDAGPVLSEEARREAILQAIRSFAGGLEALATDQVSKKNLIEERWLEDLRQFHGRYDSETEAKLRADKTKSRLYVNLTRTKTHGWEARLGDLLFPTDDRNWAIMATPVPEMSRQANALMREAMAATDKANALAKSGQPEAAEAVAEEGNKLAQQQAELEQKIKAAKAKAELMETQINDDFVECRYDMNCRDAIRDMMRLGTAIIKGPVTAQKMARKWVLAPPTVDPQTSQPVPQGFQLEQSPDPKPDFPRVDPWSFFPDMSASCIDQAEFTFERHLWNKKDVRAAAKRLGFDQAETVELLKDSPRGAMPNYWAQLRDITQNTAQSGMDSRYVVWEYHGTIEDDDLDTLVAASGNAELAAHVKANPLSEMRVIIWFCQGHILKVGPSPLDSGESLYSVTVFEHDDTSMFGFGVPYLMRDSQKAINGAWRMMMDNAALSVGPQIIVDSGAITPADNEWDIKPRKIWFMNTTSMTKYPEGVRPFQAVNIEVNQATLGGIINLGKQFADEETNMPTIAYGEQATHVTKTAQGMSMLMNSVNVVFRRVVKQWDDTMTVPNLRRAYDWNMQFSSREDIKGDYCVEARGSSVLLVREVQSQTLLSMLTQFSGNPVLGPLMKTPEAFRKFVQTQMIHAADIVKTDAEIAEDQARAAALAAQGPQIDPTEQAKIDSAREIAGATNQNRLDVAELNRETALIVLAEQKNMSLEELNAKLKIERERNAHKERTVAAQMGHDERTRQAGGKGDQVGVTNL